MTLSVLPSPATSAALTDVTTRAWAVMEVHQDGSLSRPQLVRAAGPGEAAVTSVRRRPRAMPSADLTALIWSRVGLVHAANGRLVPAARALTRGAHDSTPSRAADECAAQLALVEAFQGDLDRAARHIGRAHDVPGTTGGLVHARLAGAWIQLERGHLDEAARLLDQVDDAARAVPDPWLSVTGVLLAARVLIARAQPDAATRLLAASPEMETPGRTTEWIHAHVVTAYAECLLAAGEPHRSLAAVTPLPAQARAHSSVVAAAARMAIGDIRGARAALGAVADFDRAPLSVQVRAWLLEAQLAEQRGDHDRARLLVERTLREASAQGMTTALLPEAAWLHSFVDRHACLARTHREFLSMLPREHRPQPRRELTLASAPPAWGAALTQRETQVLELLAQMYSTDEIAATLYVSANTVKTHLKGIFGKFCVNRRVDAVRRGRQLGLC